MEINKAEEERKRKFMEARGGSVGEGYIKVNGEWVVDKTLKKARMAELLKEINLNLNSDGEGRWQIKNVMTFYVKL